jgi:hypothetical protein
MIQKLLIQKQQQQRQDLKHLLIFLAFDILFVTSLNFELLFLVV